MYINLHGRKGGQAPLEPELDCSYHILYIKTSFLTLGTRASEEQWLMTGLKSIQMLWMELEKKLTFTILTQVKKKRIFFFPLSKGSTHRWFSESDMRQNLTSAPEILGENETIFFHCCLVFEDYGSACSIHWRDGCGIQSIFLSVPDWVKIKAGHLQWKSITFCGRGYKYFESATALWNGRIQD